jgi:hydroxypyruvate isomerase
MTDISRRSLLGFGASAAVSGLLMNNAGAEKIASPTTAQGAKKLRLSVTWGNAPRLPVPEALAKLNELGYDAYEMFDWRNPDTLAVFEREHKKYNMECSCLIGNKGVSAPGCSLVNPAEREQFLKEMAACVEACKRMDCKQIVTLTGNEVPGMTREAMMQSAIEGLRAVAPMLEKAGIIATVEILNTYRDHAGYFLTTNKDGATLIDGANSPSVKILFDIYHVQIMEGNLIENIRHNIKRISHFHIGDVPGRHQPGTGEINYRNVFKAIVDLNFPGTAALEYGPTIPQEEDLKNMRAMTTFA